MEKYTCLKKKISAKWANKISSNHKSTQHLFYIICSVYDLPRRFVSPQYMDMNVFLFVGLPYKSAYPNLSTKGVNETKTIDKLYIPVCKIQDRFVWYN